MFFGNLIAATVVLVGVSTPPSDDLFKTPVGTKCDYGSALKEFKDQKADPIADLPSDLADLVRGILKHPTLTNEEKLLEVSLVANGEARRIAYTERFHHDEMSDVVMTLWNIAATLSESKIGMATDYGFTSDSFFPADGPAPMPAITTISALADMKVHHKTVLRVCSPANVMQNLELPFAPTK